MSVDFSVVIPETGVEAQVNLSPHFNDLVLQADACVVWDESSLAAASDLGKFVSEALKRAEEERTKITQPINEGLRALNSRFKQFTDPLMKARDKIADSIRMYTRAERERMEAEAAKARAAIEIKEAEPKPNSPADLGFAPVPGEVMPPPAPVKAPALKARGNFGSTSVGDDWKHELEDIEKVPPEFIVKTLNDALIKKAIKSGTRQIPGVRIFQHENVRFR